MSIDDFLSYPAPEWSSKRDMEEALRSARLAIDQSSMSSSYYSLMDAVGNNHAGTYYPVAIVLVHALEPLLVDESKWPRIVALEVLISLIGSFELEAGFESFLLNGAICTTAIQLASEVRRLAPVLRLIQESTALDAEERNLASEILDVLESE